MHDFIWHRAHNNGMRNRLCIVPKMCVVDYVAVCKFIYNMPNAKAHTLPHSNGFYGKTLKKNTLKRYPLTN